MDGTDFCLFLGFRLLPYVSESAPGNRVQSVIGTSEVVILSGASRSISGDLELRMDFG